MAPVLVRASIAGGIVAAVLAFTIPTEVVGQHAYSHGQNVAPVFEGWEPNPDGTFNMVFGFFNRNCEEVVHVPVGPNNRIEPDGPDRGQPAHFYPRRGKFVFKVPVPADFGDNELVWTLTAHGKTEQAYATLHPEYIIDKRITMMNEAGFGQRAGEAESFAPELHVDGPAQRTVAAGEPLTITARATDDGLPKPRAGREDSDAAGLLVGWTVYRGEAEHVTFDPEQFNPDLRSGSRGITICRNKFPPAPAWAKERLSEDGTFTVTATFAEPGTYMLRAMAHDGGLKTTREITVNVTG